MSISITASVGQGGKNRPDDVKTVQTLLNGHIQRGNLTMLTPLIVSGHVAPNGDPTVKAIREFQSRVAGFKNPDGRVDPGGKTMKALTTEPHSPAQAMEAINMAITAAAAGPPPTIPGDMWNAAMNSLIGHIPDARLKTPYLVTLIDFRPRATAKRLWVVDLRSRGVLHHELVTHGSGSAAKGAPRKAVYFSNTPGSNQSSLGAFVALHKYTSSLGGRTGAALVVEGLDSSNSKARSRGIRFHGATYVKPGSVGNSHGCFASAPDVNDKVVSLIQGGSFVYSYA